MMAVPPALVAGRDRLPARLHALDGRLAELVRKFQNAGRPAALSEQTRAIERHRDIERDDLLRLCDGRNAHDAVNRGGHDMDHVAEVDVFRVAAIGKQVERFRRGEVVFHGHEQRPHTDQFLRSRVAAVDPIEPVAIEASVTGDLFEHARGRRPRVRVACEQRVGRMVFGGLAEPLTSSWYRTSGRVATERAIVSTHARTAGD